MTQGLRPLSAGIFALIRALAYWELFKQAKLASPVCALKPDYPQIDGLNTV